MNLSESRLALLVAIATLVVNTWMAIQNWTTRKRKPRKTRRGRHRKR